MGSNLNSDKDSRNKLESFPGIRFSATTFSDLNSISPYNCQLPIIFEQLLAEKLKADMEKRA